MAYTYKGSQPYGGQESEPERQKRAKKVRPAHKLKPCGTVAAYRRHVFNGEIACGPCLAASSAYSLARYHRTKPKQQPKPLHPCGTHAAYKRHLRRGEDTDATCREANYTYHREYKAKRKAANA